MNVLVVDYTADDAPQHFCHSLKETGFAVIKNHPIPINLIQECYDNWKQFFCSEQKNQWTYQKPAQDGYFPLRSENAKDQKISDLKEFYHYYPWGKTPEDLKSATHAMYLALELLAAELLQWVENFLPEQVSKQLSMPLKEMIKGSPNTLLRILHYPAVTTEDTKDAIRAAPHEDINLITLLPTATAPGLEVLDRNNQWHAVPCDAGSIVVNVGDMLQMCTNEFYRSTTHRVINPPKDQNMSRFSMPLFLHPREDVLLSETITAVDYLHERLRAIGIY